MLLRGRAPSSERRALQGWRRSTRAIATCALARLAAPGVAARGAAEPRPTEGPSVGVSFLEHSGPWAWPGEKVLGLCGLCVGEDTFPNHREGVTSVVQGLAGRGRVFVWPGGARLSAQPSIRWEGLGARAGVCTLSGVRGCSGKRG